jgi:hypothetical protein
MKKQKGQIEAGDRRLAPVIGVATSEASRSIALPQETDDDHHSDPVVNMEPVWLDALPPEFGPCRHVWFFTTRDEIVIAGGHYADRRGLAIDDAALLNVDRRRQVRIRYDLAPSVQIIDQSPVRFASI